MAVGTHSNTPHAASKPGELGRAGSNINASPGIPVTGNIKNDAFRIGKGVRVCAVDGLVLCDGSNHVEALTTDNCIRCRHRCLVLRRCNGFVPHLSRLGIRSEQIHKSVWRCSTATVSHDKRCAHDHLPVLRLVDRLHRVGGERICPILSGHGKADAQGVFIRVHCLGNRIT